MVPSVSEGPESRRRTVGALASACTLLALLAVTGFVGPGPAGATNHLVILDEVLASWQGDSEVQFIELRMLAAGQNDLTGAEIEILDRRGEPVARFQFTGPVPIALEGSRVLIATEKLANLAGFSPDFPLPPRIIPRGGGKICYRAPVGPDQTTIIDCVAYGSFDVPNGAFGDPTPVTPDNRSLQRVLTASPPDNDRDWDGQLSPHPTTNAGERFDMRTECNNGRIDAGEDCDGSKLDGKTCTDFGFAAGTLGCVQCKFDTSQCNDCGNGVADKGERCDGTDLRGRTCTKLGYTRGTLGCASDCTLDESSCEELQITGTGTATRDCYLEWSVINPGARVRRRRPSSKQRCTDNDPSCDLDGGTLDACTYRVHLCFNREDSRLKRCRPRQISGFKLLRPSAADPTQQANALALLDAASALGTSTRDGETVVFETAVSTPDVCSPPASIVVPVDVRAGAPPRKGRLVIKAVAADSRGRRDKDQIKLDCRPR